MKKFLPLLALLSLAACASGPADNYKAALNARHVSLPESYKHFQQCHGYGCRYVDTIALTDKDWKDIKKIFQPAPKNAVEERKRIAKAIGMFETKVGKTNGTSEDIHGTFVHLGTKQLDCVDESTNTTTYLLLLKQGGLLKYHAVYSPDSRVPPLILIGGWPHRTATMAEIKTGEVFAVDSWFWNNGHPPEIMPLKVWKAGWMPKDFIDG